MFNLGGEISIYPQQLFFRQWIKDHNFSMVQSHWARVGSNKTHSRIKHES